MRAVASDSVADGFEAAFFLRKGFGDAEDPEAGEGFVIAGGFGVLASGGGIVFANGGAETVESGGGVFVNPGGGDGDVGGVGPLLFGEGSSGEGGDEGGEL